LLKSREKRLSLYSRFTAMGTPWYKYIPNKTKSEDASGSLRCTNKMEDGESMSALKRWFCVLAGNLSHSQAQGIEAEIPQERRRRAEELERIARSGTCAGCAQIHWFNRVGIRGACIENITIFS
jgi:hypothetical protein